MSKLNLNGSSRNSSEYALPDFFETLIGEGVVSEKDIRKTDDGFFAINKCIADILAERDIRTFMSSRGILLECNKYFDDWYFFAVPSGSDFVYSLFKLREQEYDMYSGEKADNDTPGVTVCFIAFKTAVFMNCLNNPAEENRGALNDEINRVVAYSGQKHHADLKKYFCKTQAKGAYLIAELYIRHIVSFTHKGFIIVPQRYEELFNESLTLPSGHKTKRLPDFIDENNKNAGRTVCDHDKIYIADPANPDLYEKLAILATHTADTSFNCFAAEVQYHALFLFSAAKIRIPFFGGSVYASAIRADLSVDDSEFEGTAPYHRKESKFVNRHKQFHGNF